MFGRKKAILETDDEAKQLLAFVENVERADTLREEYQGNFIAVFDNDIVEFDTEHRSLMSKISEEYLDKKQLYISYIPKTEEVLLV